MITREVGEFEGVRRDARDVASHQFEQGRVHFPVRVRANMRDARDPQMGAVNERNRARNVAQRPQSYCEIEHCGDPGVLSEAKGQIVVAARLEQGERAFQMIARFSVLAGKPAGDAGGAMGDAGLWRIGSGLGIA